MQGTYIYRRDQRLMRTEVEARTKDAFEEFADIGKVLQPSPSAKMAWYSNFTIAIFLLQSVCLLPSLP